MIISSLIAQSDIVLVWSYRGVSNDSTRYMFHDSLALLCYQCFTDYKESHLHKHLLILTKTCI